MALVFNLNRNPNTWSGCLMELWLTMVNAGWLVMSWSDGTTAHGSPGAGFLGFTTSSAGRPLDTGGAGSAQNNFAWILLQQPAPSGSIGAPYGGTRQISWQRSNTNSLNWRVKYSVTGTYSNPSTAGTATATPGANAATNDEVIMWGGGTDASPTFAGIFTSAGGWEGFTRCHSMADNGLGATGSQMAVPYGFAMWCPSQGGSITTGNTAILHGQVYDPQQQGTAVSVDIDPFVWYLDLNGSAFYYNAALTNDSNGFANPRGWSRKGMTGAAFTGYAYYNYRSTNQSLASPTNVGGNALSSTEDLLPMVLARRGASGGLSGYKGVSSMMRWIANNHVSGDTLSLSVSGSTRDRIVAGYCALPWDGITVPLI